MPTDLQILSFNAGEWSPHLDGRSDLEKYYSGCRILENMIPLPYGDAERRPGTYYVAELKDSSKKARLISFQYSTEQAYIIEAGDQYMRSYKDRGQIQANNGTEDYSALSANLVAQWKLNDNLATTAVLDAVASVPHDGVATSNTEDISSIFVTSGIGGTCFDFGGVESVAVADSMPLSFGDGANDSAFSIAAWVYYTEKRAEQTILSKRRAASLREYYLHVTVSGDVQFVLLDDSVPATIGVITDDVLTKGWHLIVATYDGTGGATGYTGMSIYVDGVAVDITQQAGGAYVAMENLGADLLIGARDDSSPTKHWADKMDNIALFDKELSAAEVANLYSEGPYEVATAYLEADLSTIQYVQSADVLFLNEGSYPPAKLLRYAHDDWVLEDYAFDDEHWPPFLDENETTTSITVTGAGAAPLAVGLAVTLTASKTSFTSDHVGSYWLITHPRTHNDSVQPNFVRDDHSGTGAGTILKDVKGSWHFRTSGSWAAQILIERSYDSGTTWHTLGDVFHSKTDQNFNVSGEEEEGGAWYRSRVTGFTGGSDDVRATLGVERYYHYGIVKVTAFTSATVVTGEVVRQINSESATKLWSEGAWSDERGYPVAPAFYEGRLWHAGSSYKPLTLWGSKGDDYENHRVDSVLADDPVKFNVDASMQNRIRWLVGQEVLLIGTGGAEWKLGSADPTDAIAPDNPMKPRRQTPYGSAEIQALLLANVVLFVDQKKRKVRGAQYVWEKGEAGAYDAPDYTQLAEHITESGIVGMAYQQNPYPTLWCVRTDGVLIGMTFEPGEKVWGWFRCVIDGLVESVAVIPGVTEDEVWIIVKRTINGATKRYMEYFKPRDWGDDQADCFFVDCGLTFDGGDAVTITGITRAAPGVVTAAAHDFSDGDQVKIATVVGMTEVNNKVFTVSNPATDTFELRDNLDTVDWRTSEYSAYVSGGTVQKVDNTFYGLEHLEGKTVSVLGDGSVHANVVVSSGVITLTDYFNKVHVGLPYKSKLQPMKLALQTPSGTTRGKVKRISQIIFSFYKTLGAKFGTTSGSETIPFRKTTDAMGSAPPLFTGEKGQTFPGGYELNGDIYVEQDQPLPMTVRSIIAMVGIYG